MPGMGIDLSPQRSNYPGVGLAAGLPGRTEADLFAWMSLHRDRLRESYGDYEKLADLAQSLLRVYKENPAEKMSRQVRRLFGAEDLPRLGAPEPASADERNDPVPIGGRILISCLIGSPAVCHRRSKGHYNYLNLLAPSPRPRALMDCLEESVRVPILRPCRYPPLIALLLLIVGVLTTACGSISKPTSTGYGHGANIGFTLTAIRCAAPPCADDKPARCRRFGVCRTHQATVVAASSRRRRPDHLGQRDIGRTQASARRIAAEFADRMGVNVAVQLVSPGLLPDLVSTGVLSGTLPDLVLYPNEFTAGWVADGILDPTAADEVIERLGRDTFDPSALDLVEVDNVSAAIPSDGFHQLLLYRADWFEDLGLAALIITRPWPRLQSGYTIPRPLSQDWIYSNRSNLVTTHQAFEQIALANGCRLIDEAGGSSSLNRRVARRSSTTFDDQPILVLRGADGYERGHCLLTGRTGMIITSPAILPLLAGFDESKCLRAQSVTPWRTG